MNQDNKALDELKHIYDEVKGWVHFAEGKHGALVAVNIVLIFKCTDFFININDKQIVGSKLFLIIIMSIFMIATGITMVSFIPNLKKVCDSNSCTCCNCKTDKILIFFGDISTYPSEKLYLHHFYKKYYNEDVKGDFSKLEQDYAKEIIINSRIANYKFILFKWAIYLEILGLILLLIFWISNISL